MTLTPLGSASLLSDLAWNDHCILAHISNPFKTKIVHSEAEAQKIEKQGWIVERPKEEEDWIINGKHMWKAYFPYTEEQKKEYKEHRFLFRYFWIVNNYNIQLAKEWEKMNSKDDLTVQIPFCLDDNCQCSMECDWFFRGCHCTPMIINYFQQQKDYYRKEEPNEI